MWITRISINNPVFATMVMVALTVLGIFSYNRLSVERLPNVSPPVVFISISYPGASPEAIETDITKPIEEAVNSVSGIKQIRSSSKESRSETVVEFLLNTDMNQAVQDVRDRVATVRPGFPKDVKEPFIGRFEGDNAEPVVTYALVSDTVPLRDLSSLADQVVVKQFQKAPGVGRVDTAGTAQRQMRAEIKPRELSAWGITVDQVIQAIQVANQDVSVGLVSGSISESMIRIEGKLRDTSGFAAIPIAQRLRPDGTPVTIRLSQVADVIDDEAERNSISRINGQRTVILEVYKNQDANVVETGEAIKAAAQRMQPLLPSNVELKEIWADSDWVKRSLDGVKRTIIEGAMLTVLIVFLFLKSWRSTVITGLTLPISVIATFIAVYAMGFTLNFMTMMALSLCIGLLIDDAIVVRENIVRHLRMGKSHWQAARDGTEEIGVAVMATTFTICAVFVPIAFMEGLIGRFFSAFGLTVVVAVLVSLFVSFTLDPMLSSVWPDPERQRKTFIDHVFDPIERLIDRVHAIYGKLLALALRHRWKVLGIATLSFFGAIALIGKVGTEFVPETDDGWLSVSMTMAVGSSLDRTDEKVRQVEALLKEIPEIKFVSVNIGGGGGVQGRNAARANIRLIPRDERTKSKKTLEAEIRQKLASVAGIDLAFGWNAPIQLAVLGPDPERLDAILADLMTKLKHVDGITDLRTSLQEGTPALTLKLKDGIAADLGVTAESVGRALRPLVSGEEVSTWMGPDGQNYRVVVRSPKTDRNDLSDLHAVLIPTARVLADGTPLMVPLRQVADLSIKESPREIKRQDLQRRVTISAGAQGRPPGDVGRDVKAIAASFRLPPGYRFDIGGQTREQDESGRAALGALGLAVIFIYIILASQFGSFIQPLAIMASLPLSLIGVVLALLVTGTTLNIFSIIGVIMLMGLVTKNAILLVDFANHGRRDGKSITQALLDAGQVRLRPILMTTFAMVFGMLPLALALGEGAEIQAGMGRAIIGGVITSTLLTLVVVPVLYAMFEGVKERRRARRQARLAGAAAQTAPAAPAD